MNRSKWIIIIFVFILPLLTMQAQDSDTLAFAYVTLVSKPEASNAFDLQVVDVISGEKLYSFDTDAYNCSGKISPDNHWLVYNARGSHPAESMIIDLATGETVATISALISPIHWQDNTLFYQTLQNLDTLLYQYDILDQQGYDLITIKSPDSVPATRWFNDDLVFLIQQKKQLQIHRRSNTLERFYRPDETIYGVGLSPNTNYISYIWKNSSDEMEGVILDTQVNRSQKITVKSQLSWFNYSDQLVYVDVDNDIVLYDAQTKESHTYDTSTIDDEMLSQLLMVSPDDRYIAFQIHSSTEDIEHPFKILDLSSGEIVEFGKELLYSSYQIKWVDDTHLAYINPTGNTPAVDEEGHEYVDMWVYDVASGKSLNISHTPEINENFDCSFG